MHWKHEIRCYLILLAVNSRAHHLECVDICVLRRRPQETHEQVMKPFLDEAMKSTTNGTGSSEETP